MFNKKTQGFTIMELLITLAIVFSIFSIVIPLYAQVQNNVAVDNYAQQVTNALRLAQNRSITSLDNKKHGVHFENDHYVIFGGDSWADHTYTTTYYFDGGIQIIEGAGTDIIFDRLTGKTSEKTIKLGLTNGKQDSILVDAVGQISIF